MGEFWQRIRLQRIITAYTANPRYPQNDSIQIQETKPYSKGKCSIKVLGCVTLDLSEIQTFCYRLYQTYQILLLAWRGSDFQTLC